MANQHTFGGALSPPLPHDTQSARLREPIASPGGGLAIARRLWRYSREQPFMSCPVLEFHGQNDTLHSMPNTPIPVTEPIDGGRLNAPAAARNVKPICDLLQTCAPRTGTALEIASGTGQHVVQFARTLPGLTWQPTEKDPARLDSINAWIAHAGVYNVLPAQALNAAQTGWGAAQAGKDLIVLINLLHLIPEPDARALITETAKALVPGGRFILYGPFLRAGETTSIGDARFHASLQTSDPAIGYKDDFDVVDWLHEAGLDLVDLIDMPANNLAFVAEK